MTDKITCRIPSRSGYYSITIDGNTITSILPVNSPQKGTKEVWLSPGLFDLQVNGMIGYNISEKDLTVEHIVAIETALEQRGITRWCPTVTTEDPILVERNLQILSSAIESKATTNIHCIHLEGHYISGEEGYRGIHPQKWIRDPDFEEFNKWQQAAQGNIGLFSLSPERKGSLTFINKLKMLGIKIGLVHHNSDIQTISLAIAYGADLASHLVNGCASLINRQHNVIWSQLSFDELWASFIADGYHIPYYTLRSVIKAKGISKSIIVSDLAHLSGLPDGEYTKKGLDVVVKNGGLWVKDKGTELLAGSVKTLNESCEYLTSHSGFSIEDSLIMASLNPARYMGIEGKFDLYVGYKGPLVVFGWEKNKLSIERVFTSE